MRRQQEIRPPPLWIITVDLRRNWTWQWPHSTGLTCGRFWFHMAGALAFRRIGPIRKWIYPYATMNCHELEPRWRCAPTTAILRSPLKSKLRAQAEKYDYEKKKTRGVLHWIVYTRYTSRNRRVHPRANWRWFVFTRSVSVVSFSLEMMAGVLKKNTQCPIEPSPKGSRVLAGRCSSRATPSLPVVTRSIGSKWWEMLVEKKSCRLLIRHLVG